MSDRAHATGDSCRAEEGCITCGDTAVPMRVVTIDRHRGLALCEDGSGARADVETALVEPVLEEEMLLVHAGTAIARAVEAAPR